MSKEHDTLRELAETATPEQIDAGAKYLRETMQAGKNLTPWSQTPKATKKKWIALSEGFLRAALTGGQDHE